MKVKLFFLFGSLCLIACDYDVYVDPDVPEPPKYPFESLDESYFNQASSQLDYPETLLRVDSVVSFRYYKFNPETGISDYQVYSKGNTVYSPPPPEPTKRTTEVYYYDENNKLERIESYREESDSQVDKGELLDTAYFTYDNDNNLIRQGDLLEQNNYFTEYYYNEGTLTGYKFVSGLYEVDTNIQHNGQKLIISTDYSTTTLTIDSYKNLINYERDNSNTTQEITFKYPKNIFSPYYQIFPNNFISHVYWSLNTSGSTHFSSSTSDSFYQKVQLNEFYYPEVVQNGSYDDGYRTKYYYSRK